MLSKMRAKFGVGYKLESINSVSCYSWNLHWLSFDEALRKCRLYEHYGFWTEGGLKMFDECFWNKEFLLSTEDTAVDMSVLKYFKHEFVMGATSFKMKAAVYNIFHGYDKGKGHVVCDDGSNEDEEIDCETENAKGLSKKRKR